MMSSRFGFFLCKAHAFLGRSIGQDSDGAATLALWTAPFESA
jgi:hypothetical protein